MSDAKSRIASEDQPRVAEIRSGALVSGDALAAMSPDAIIAIDDYASIVFANPKTERLFGYPIGELLGRNVSMLLPQRLRQNNLARLCRVKQRRQRGAAGPWSTFVGLRRGGQEIPLQRSVACWDENDNSVVVWFVRNISAHQRAEHIAMERSALLGQIADGVVIADPKGRVTFVNEAAWYLLGTAPPGRRVDRFAVDAQILTPDGQPYPMDELPLTRTVRTGATIVDAELMTKRSDGTQAIVQASSTPIVAKDGTRLGSVATFRDVSAQREVEQRKSEFIGAVSHELRTPITVIQGQAQFLAHQVAVHGIQPSAEVVPRLEKINQTAQLMTGMVNRLIEATHSQFGEIFPVTPRSPIRSATKAPAMEAIGEVARALVQEMALERVASIIVDHGLRLFNAAGAAVWLFDPQREELRPLAMRAVTTPSPLTLNQLQALPLDQTTIAGSAARSKQPVEIPDIRAAISELTLARGIFEREHFRSGYAQPLVARDRLVGVLTILNVAPHAFFVQERALIQALGDFSAAAIDHARVYRQLEEAVDQKAESLALLDTLVETAPIGFAFLDRQLRIVQINRTLASLGSTPTETYIGREVQDALPWLADAAGSILRGVLAAGATTIDVEIGGDGCTGPIAGRCWLASFYPVCPSNGNVRGVGIVMAEITHRKQAERDRDLLLHKEQEARKQAESLAAERAAILGHIADGVLLVDASELVTFQNDAARRMIGPAKIGTFLTDFTRTIRLGTPDGKPYVTSDLLLVRALSKSETNVRVEQHAHPPGMPAIILESSAAPVVAEDGTPLGAVLSLRDVTAQRELEHERDAFYSAATHDLKNPLTVILGSAERLEQLARRSGQPELQELVPNFEKMANTSKRMVSLIDELLDVTRVRQGRPLDLQRRPSDLVSLIRQVVAEHQILAERVQIQVVSEARHLVGCWDAARLGRLFGNLVTNAIKYSPAGGDIVVEVAADGKSHDRWAIVKVRDHGIGIPAADLLYIFEPFQRATNVGPRIQGSGIGLTSARYLIQQHGGTITAESVEGVGSTFTVRLPLKMAGQRAAA